jgi:hypothetical protein
MINNNNNKDDILSKGLRQLEDAKMVHFRYFLY